MKWLDTGVSHQFEPDEQSKKKGKDIITSLRGKVALVVGGSSGVGKATVKALLSEGAHVTAVARERTTSVCSRRSWVTGSRQSKGMRQILRLRSVCYASSGPIL